MSSLEKLPRTMLRSPSHESMATDLSLLSVSSLSIGRHLTCKTPVELQRGPSPNPEIKINKRPRPSDVPLDLEEGAELLRGCALLCSALGLRRSLSTGDVPRALSPPPAARCGGSEARLSWAGGGGAWLAGAASRSCSTWVAVGDSRLPSPHRPAPPDLLQPLPQKVNHTYYSPVTETRQVYIRRRLMTTYKALERMSHSEFNLDRLEVSRGAALTLRDVERERGRPLSKYERNMMIFDWLHTLEEGAGQGPELDGICER